MLQTIHCCSIIAVRGDYMFHDESKEYEPVLEHAQRIAKQEKPYGEMKNLDDKKDSKSQTDKKE